MRGFWGRADQGHEIYITKSLTSASVIVENTIFIHESICPIHPANQMIQKRFSNLFFFCEFNDFKPVIAQIEGQNACKPI